MPLEIVAEYDPPGGGPAGLTWDGQHLWHADYRDGRIYHLTDAAEIVDSLWCPGNLSGLAWGTQALWQAVYDEGIVRRINPETTDFDQTVDLKAYGRVSGVAWDGSHLRTVVQQTGDILSVEPESGAVLSHLPGPVATGDIDCRDGVLWLSVGGPMIYSVEDDEFNWVDTTRSYALVELDARDGRELRRHTASGLYTGLSWGADGALWLASASEGKLYRAIVTPA